jgi:hypothetical protein
LVDLQASETTEEAVVETVGKNSTLLDSLFAIPRERKVRFGTKEEPSRTKNSSRTKAVEDSRCKGARPRRTGRESKQESKVT